MQKTQVIDITKSYLPGDPNAFPENLIATDREDGEEKTYPIMPYEAKNVLPTAYGYRSYFGVDSVLVGDNVPANCDQIILFQTNQYENMLVAFTAAGVYTRLGAAVNWTQSFALTDTWTASQIYKEYTWCVIENDLYIYRQGHTHVLKISYAGAFSSFIPSFLNMAGQMGIFRANGRLGFWDSANSVSWSSAFDLTDFTPNLETIVGNTIFLGVQGRIVNIKAHGEGFIIYCTKSIVGISYNTQGAMLWDAMTLTSAGGIGYTRAVTTGASDKEHFVYTSIGIFVIGHFNALSRQYDMQQIAPELYDYLKESRDPVYLDMMGGRYLHFGLINSDYINGIVSLEDNQIDQKVVHLTYNGVDWLGGDTLPATIEGNSAYEMLSQIFADNTPGTSVANNRNSGRGMTAVWKTTSNSYPTANESIGLPSDTDYGDKTTTSGVSAGTVKDRLNDQLNAWAAFKTNQTAHISDVVAQGGTINTDGPLLGEPPAIPATTVVTTTTGYFPSGDGPIDVFKLSNGRVIFRKYFSKGYRIDKTITTSYSQVTLPPAVGNFVTTIVYRSGTYFASQATGGAVNTRKAAGNTLASAINQACAFAGTHTVDTSPTGANNQQRFVYNSPVSAPVGTAVTGSYASYTTINDYLGGSSETSSTPHSAYPNAYPDLTTTDNSENTYKLRTTVLTQYSVVPINSNMGFSDFVVTPESYVLELGGVGYASTPRLDNGNPYGAYVPAARNYPANPDRSTWVFNSTSFPVPEQFGGVNDTSLFDTYTFTFPSVTFTLQSGSISPAYPTFVGSLIFDTQLKKWGKNSSSYKTLVSFSPLNETQNQTISTTNFGIDSGILATNNTIRLFSASVINSLLKYGKVGFYRQGFTDGLEVRLQFRLNSTGTVDIEPSYDGKLVNTSAIITSSFTDALEHVVYFDRSARWFNIAISGQFDLTNLEFVGRISARR